MVEVFLAKITRMTQLFSCIHLVPEPGFYVAGEFGIRIESLVEVVDAAAFTLDVS